MPSETSGFKDVPIKVTISVGTARPTVRELLSLDENTILTLDRRVTDPVELFIGDKLIARGELQEVEGESGQLAVRLIEVSNAVGSAE